MEFHQLEYFLAVAKYHSFTKAAEEINVSQSSLSIQISKLESELRVRLFERTARSVYLTSAGKKFIPLAESIMESSTKAKTVMENYISADRGTILIGAFPGSIYFGFIELISQFKQHFPNIKFDIHETECLDLLSVLKTFEIDVAFLSEFAEADGVKFYPLHKDHLVLVLNRDHVFAGRDSLSLEEIYDEPLILNDHTTIHKIVMERFNKLGLDPNISLRTHGTQLPSTLGFVTSGFGVTMLSSRVAKYYEHWGFTTVDIQPHIPRSTYLAVTEANEKRPIISNFIKFILKNTVPLG